VNSYRTVTSGPHIKAICNGCDRYIKFIPKNEVDFCPKCGEVNSLKTEEYGCFHTITKCSNCKYSDITNINKSLSDVEPMENKIMTQQPTWGAPAQPAPAPVQQQQKTLAPIRLFPAHPNAPDFVLASGVIGLDEFFAFVQANPHLLTEYQGKAQLKFQILRSKEGKLYSQVDDYKPQQPAAQQPAPQQWGGHTTSPVYQPAQQPAQQWGAQPVQQPAAAGWGAPQQTAANSVPQPYGGELPF
jgi:predicted RNA-binding Zn-ribbon protein involved in translation (DUF1610 family)